MDSKFSKRGKGIEDSKSNYGEEVNVSEKRHVIIFAVIFIVLVIVSQLDYLFKYSFNEAVEVGELMSVDTTASATEIINEGNANAKLSTLSKNQKTFIAEIDIQDNVQFLHIRSMYGNFRVPLYTLRDYDIDKGLVPKNYSYYPEIKVNVVGSLSTHGVLIETTQISGYQTYSNKVYIRGSKVMDVGFQKRLSVNDNIKYYDNAILIVDSVNTVTKDFIRVYDDETGVSLFDINASEFNLDKGSLDNLSFTGVSDHFITYSLKYNGMVEDGFIHFFEDGSFENISVWDKLNATEEQIKKLKDYELNTSSDCITFIEYNQENELVYRVKYLDGSSTDSIIKIKLD